jgi:hypothetical protein
MRRPAFVVAVLLVAGALASGCSSEQAEELRGVWSGEDAEAKRHTFSFKERGRAIWAVESEGETQSYEVRYTFDDSATPHRLDLSGFESGALHDKTLYCILEFESASAFRMDCAAGATGEAGESVRPTGFGDNALLYMKVE